MLIECLLDSARRHANKTAAADTIRCLTYGGLVASARAIRQVILDETSQERVGLMLPASSAGVAALFGSFWANKQAVPLNFLLQARELQPIVADAGLDLILGTEHFAPLLSQLPVRSICIENLDLEQRVAAQKLQSTPEPPAVRPDDVACILYTSGTTGQPKGVCLTHNNFVSNAHAAIQRLRLTPDEHLLGLVPPFHIFGLSVLNILPVILGGTVTSIPRFSPQAMYRAIATQGVSILLAVPSMYGAMARLKEIDKSVFRGIRIAASGGEPLPRTIYNQVLERTGVTLVEGYGMTETSPIISVDLPWAHRVGTVGPPLDGVEVQLRNAQGEVLHAGSAVEGELCVRGPLIMKGYYRRSEETSSVIDPQGWLRTGDIARIGEAGSLAITGRAKELIIVAGENVYPREVENILEEHPAVAEAAVIGRQDGSRGEVVVAFVTLREGANAREDELRGFCRERLASFKTPREIHIRAELPRGPTGKILKRQLGALLHETPLLPPS